MVPTIPPPCEPGRNPSDFRHRGDIPAHDSPCSNDRSCPNRYAGQQYGADSNIGVGKDSDWLNHKIGRNGWNGHRHTGMHGPEDLATRPKPNIVLQHKVTSIEKALRTNPNPIADTELSVEST